MKAREKPYNIIPYKNYVASNCVYLEAVKESEDSYGIVSFHSVLRKEHWIPISLASDGWSLFESSGYFVNPWKWSLEPFWTSPKDERPSSDLSIEFADSPPSEEDDIDDCDASEVEDDVVTSEEETFDLDEPEHEDDDDDDVDFTGTVVDSLCRRRTGERKRRFPSTFEPMLTI